MFTGIVTDIGTVTEYIKNNDLYMVIKTSYHVNDINIGASIAHSGVCLTVIKKFTDSYAVQVSDETINRTNIGSWQKGTQINLERSLRLQDEIGGHIVSGHVDGLVNINAVESIGESYKLTLLASDELKYFIAEKGSVAIDGVSLTVNTVNDNKFSVNVIPHTWKNTTLSNLAVGNRAHMEIDILARYAARLNEKYNDK